MGHFSRILKGFIVLAIFWNASPVLAVTNCVINPVTGYCTFLGITINRTHPYFEPSYPNPSQLLIVAIEQSRAHFLTDEICKRFPGILSLIMTHSYLRRIENGALSNCKKLSSLALSNNNLTHIDKNLFTSNAKLSYLHLGYNRITYVDVEAFRTTTALKFLYLSHNFLVHFNFGGMPRLASVLKIKLNHNNLLDLDEKAVLQKFPNMEGLHMEDNLFECANLQTILDTITNFNNRSFELMDSNETRRVSPRERPYRMRQIQLIDCVELEDHKRASADSMDLIGKLSRLNCSEDGEIEVDGMKIEMGTLSDDTRIKIIVIQCVTTTLILCCITVLIWHGLFWHKAINSVLEMDTGDYYYCNYFSSFQTEEPIKPHT